MEVLNRSDLNVCLPMGCLCHDNSDLYNDNKCLLQYKHIVSAAHGLVLVWTMSECCEITGTTALSVNTKTHMQHLENLQQ